ncbi:type II toxin-antitoxin system death-on-curing family toxin [Xanthomonas arboricola]|uniref:Type II toxin-antitoxin system death-on-curing family toxin n=1 Tax=Xanthomonas arboricola TaxID=56448 RepID=A0A2S7AA68_9XANT|nr:type II toxin-antitoxin system death-on-curing family toxin [Xanthomonas arboricola]PPU06045.1 type II toxin-antitoxin system death-on-curing family toxin [Xanthomonas arboricola]
MNTRMVVWITHGLALAILERQLSEHGGVAGVRDEALLDSTLARPQQLFSYGAPLSDLVQLTASLAYGLAHHRPFVDGNKHTAHMCYRVFLMLNDAKLMAPQEEKYVALMGLAGGVWGKADFSLWLRPRVRLQGQGHLVVVVLTKR